MIFLKTFDQTPEYNDFILTEDYLLPNVSVCRDNQTKVYYNPWESYDYSQDYLTFEALESGTFTWTDTANSNSIYYSLDDGSTWTQLTSGSSTPTINANDKVLFKGSNLSINLNSNYGIGKFSSTGNFNISGNIMSLIYGDNFISQTTLLNYQFTGLFFNCPKLIDAFNLILPSTTLAKYCYYNMFRGCTSLVTTPELPATTLADWCYYQMFEGCTSLVTAPELPATTLTIDCYACMFQNCTSLTTAPSTLPATTLAQGCYSNMFYNCTSLTTAPSTLPATTLSTFCYDEMFSGCTSLTTAPELPATTLTTSCYYQMFQGCSKLNYIKAMFTTTPGTDYTNNWLDGVAATGVFVKNSAATWNVPGKNGVPEWVIITSEKNITGTTQLSSPNYVIITNINSIGLIQKSSNQTIYISNDHENWEEMTTGYLYNSDINKTIYICGNLTANNESDNYTQFYLGGINISMSGNINAIWNYSNVNATLKRYCGYKMFRNCASLTTVPSNYLPATTLAYGCYNEMFYGCTSLTTAPELPATTLTTYCYRGMFGGCTSLTTVPELPTTTLAYGCYREMFFNCTSLTTVPSNYLPATTLIQGCYQCMFSGCTSLTTAPALPATTLAIDCYASMFNGCTSLTTAPELPATTLADWCYNYMFCGCSNLNYIKAMFTTKPGTNYTTNWVDGVASNGTFVKNSAATWDVKGPSGVPSRWIVATAAA